MNSIKDVRRQNLQLLVEQYGSMKDLNRALGRRDNTLTQILCQSVTSPAGAKKQMGDRIARSIEEKLHLPYGWMDADQTGLVADENGVYDMENSYVVQEYANSAGMSKSHQQLDQDVVLGDIRLSRFFLATLGYTNPEHYLLTTITAYGDSMAPTILPGAKVLVDCTSKAFTGNGIYVLAVLGNQFVKRLTMRMNGRITITTDNPVETLAEELSGNEEVQILGKVVYYWNGFRA